MKPIDRIIVQPELDNSIRQEVVEWCDSTFYTHPDSDWRWNITSNYERSYQATFDVMFKNMRDAQWFILRWGGVISEIIYEDVPEQYFVEDKIFSELFE